MRLVVDTNRLISAAIKSGSTRKIILYAEHEFVTCEYAVTELKKHKALIAGKAGMREEDVGDLLDIILGETKILQEKAVKRRMKAALDALGDTDPSDAPFLAAALAVDADAIWSHDRHFRKQKLAKVVTNKDLL
jgi:predicted nucleic acid-binding protein